MENYTPKDHEKKDKALAALQDMYHRLDDIDGTYSWKLEYELIAETINHLYYERQPK